MFFKKKKNDYLSQIEFCFYSFEYSEFFNFFLMLKSNGFEVSKILGERDYYSDFENIVIENELEHGVIITFSNESSLYASLINYKEERIICSSFLLFYENSTFLKLVNEFVSNSKGIYYAYLNSYYDMKWQREESLSVYKANKKSLKGLCFTNDIFDNKCIDISRNFGRSIYKGGVLYTAAYISWFGSVIKEEFQNVNFEKEFLDSYSLEGNGLVKIKLFTDLFIDYETKRDVQKNYFLKLSLLELN